MRDHIRSVGDELAIDAKNSLERAFDLRWRVVLRLQAAHGRHDQFAQNGNIFRNSEAKANVCWHRGARAGMDSIAECSTSATEFKLSSIMGWYVERLRGSVIHLGGG